MQWTKVLALGNQQPGPISAGRPIKLFPLALAAIVALTAVPLGFRSPSVHLMYTRWNWADIAANMALYIPLGLFSFPGRLRRKILLAALLSIGTETAQLVAPGRFPGVLDVASNVLGALIGIGIAGWMRDQGWEPSVFSMGKPAAWGALILGVLCAAALAPLPLAGDFSNWDPKFQLAFGDEIHGDRKWNGTVLEAAVISAVVPPDVIRVLAHDGIGSILRHYRDFPAPPVFQLQHPIDTQGAASVLEPAASTALFEQATREGHLSVLLWIRTAEARQGGPARIMTYSRDRYQRNFLVGQEHRQIIFRLRTPATGLNGAEPETESAPILEPNRDTLVVATYDGRFSRVYLNGSLSGEMNLIRARFFTGVPSLGFALFAGIFLSLGLLSIWPAPKRTWMIGAAIAIAGLVWVLSVPRSGYSGLSLRLALVLLGGVLAGHMATQRDAARGRV